MSTMKKIGWAEALAFCCGIAPAAAQEDYSTWSGHENVIVNTKASGANIGGNVTGYPLLVRLDSANASPLFAAALTGGVDIRFGKTSGARLAFERERWDATARKAEFWVLMDTIKGNDSGTALRIHWGKAGAADSSSSRSVFSSSNGFLAVWHMNQPLAAAGDTLIDATGNGHKGTVALEGAATVPANLTTGIGIGKNFTGAFEAGTIITTGAYFTVRNADSALNLNTNTGPFTISAWANPAICDATSRMGLFTKYANVNTGPLGGRAYALQTANVNGNWRLTMDPLAFAGTGTATAVTEFVADVTCTQDEWTYLAASYNSNSLAPTADDAGAVNAKISRAGASGTEATTGFTATQQLQSVGNSSEVYIGRIHNLDRFFRGGVDELRVSNVERSANWNTLDYQIQRAGSRTVFVGTVPPVSVAPGGGKNSGFAIRSTGSSVRFLFPAGLAEARVSVVNLAGREVWSANVPAGSREQAWDGRTPAGARATSGSYVARITVGNQGVGGPVAESKVVLLR